jgi:hypothetical protein
MNNRGDRASKIEDRESSFNPQSEIRNPQSKEPEPDDPMDLVMVSMPGGDPQFMATCIIEEYAQLGMGEQDIFRLFSQPIYQTHAFYRQFGEAWVRDLIREVLSRTGRMRVSVVFSDQPSATNDQLKADGEKINRPSAIGHRPSAKGGCHA